ncbi:hypothetical protein [Hymenobacter persicinus]|uniref:Uncharacterized protein n=1 Tax=Hymenobacter persicinus TaxID=2025506 RepID=A0A4Q5LHU5_9BACT|nr:hypothetical protein [Hymenobacter persicinus]RYU82097.1 hypothetical protein EWM57_04760 [Hymenobacter persicinus]
MRQYLHHNDFGCISRCPTGCCLHLYFGNVALCLKRAEVTDWSAVTARLYERHAAVLPDPATRCITLPGPVACQAFVFNLEEIFMLHDLLKGASLLLEAEALLAGDAIS